MIRGVGIGEAAGAGAQLPARGALESPNGSGGAASFEQPSRPRPAGSPAGPTEANGPRVWGNGYLSPVYRFDDSTSTLFFEQRAFVSGDTTRQVPLESAVKLYRLFEQVRQSALPGQSGVPDDQGGGSQGSERQGGAAGLPQAVAQAPLQAEPPPVTSRADGADAGGTESTAGGTASPRLQAGAPVGQVLDIVA